ncbi:PadR family transcriptional regulator [Dactylosporangium sp. AC04546]|uniref:PadR family transcriptional regulator n=1 Tax=Dactylosporangium sp. AC04546 TaxID=2862460 RepID=UPI001EDEE1F5|nr:PadR family transcriptional regulator [Dactylosporangium sp. AC04546]WVK81238.1 PadR family transcriptional regulator [Dactylosporangium sp. AC04546]
MSLRYALLGLLADEPASGYDLARKFERNLRRYAWHAQHSQIYPELNRLAADGLAEVVEEGPRGRRTYAITETGRADLRRWVLDPNDDPVVRNEHTLRLFLLSTLDVEDARKMLRHQAEGSRLEYERLRAAIDAAGESGRPPVELFASELGARYFQVLHEWAVWALDRLDPE